MAGGDVVFVGILVERDVFHPKQPEISLVGDIRHAECDQYRFPNFRDPRNTNHDGVLVEGEEVVDLRLVRRGTQLVLELELALGRISKWLPTGAAAPAFATGTSR